MNLTFPIHSYTSETILIGNAPFHYRKWADIPYVSKPVSDIQKLTVYAPESIFSNQSHFHYDQNNAPILIPNCVGGYCEGPQATPLFTANGQMNMVLHALFHGIVVVCPGIRGRNTKNESDLYTGKAPALIVDMKAAIRYIRKNKGLLPGNSERIITSGTSAGGALSALAGCTGNEPLYSKYLDEIGAADERDDIFAANCYCPIINLENACSAYEWQFGGIDSFSGWLGQGEHTEDQKKYSCLLKAQFPSYLNSLSLTDEKGNLLFLNEDGFGSFLEFVKEKLLESANHSKQALENSGSYPFLTYKDGKYTDINFRDYCRFIGRMKQAPAFDNPSLSTPENDVFASSSGTKKHFSVFSRSMFPGPFADEALLHLMNPLPHIGSASLARHFRIRHGAADRDTSFAIPVLFSRALANAGIDVDFFMPWGIPHAGDYDLEEFFRWIDKICTNDEN